MRSGSRRRLGLIYGLLYENSRAITSKTERGVYGVEACTVDTAMTSHSQLSIDATTPIPQPLQHIHHYLITSG